MELLSPAKNIETAFAAINCGADAVYIGANDFSARKAAGNSIQDIEQLVNYAHLYKAKVYVTLNTILYDNE
ncbi:MAG: collagenase-like protease, partial [Bacteroidales bacterium]|nr:collagenase-like protease [Bacteroidales bacterium]